MDDLSTRINSSMDRLLYQYERLYTTFCDTEALDCLDVRRNVISEPVPVRTRLHSAFVTIPACIDAARRVVHRVRTSSLRILERQWDWLARFSVAENLYTSLLQSQVDVRMMYFWIESIRSLSMCTLEGEAATALELSPYIELEVRESDEERRKAYLGIWVEA